MRAEERTIRCTGTQGRCFRFPFPETPRGQSPPKQESNTHTHTHRARAARSTSSTQHSHPLPSTSAQRRLGSPASPPASWKLGSLSKSECSTQRHSSKTGDMEMTASPVQHGSLPLSTARGTFCQRPVSRCHRLHAYWDSSCDRA